MEERSGMGIGIEVGTFRRRETKTRKLFHRGKVRVKHFGLKGR